MPAPLHVALEKRSNFGANQTRSVELRDKIAEKIATGEFPPGVRLDESALAEQFEVSRTPIREALFQLASVGILERGPVAASRFQNCRPSDS